MTATAPKERPLLFSSAMVRALLAGTKTQTRRTRGLDAVDDPDETWSDRGHGPVRRSGDGAVAGWFWRPSTSDEKRLVLWCPYGAVGDRLWVRESIRFGAGFLQDGTVLYDGGAVCDVGPNCGRIPDASLVGYFRMLDKSKTKGAAISVPSIHMPRWACRITLEITEVRVQRLREISADDCLAEGVTVSVEDVNDAYKPALRNIRALNAYRDLWNEINGNKAWDANPWVWAISFQAVTP